MRMKFVILVMMVMMLCSCQSAKFVITEKTPAKFYNNCFVYLSPINQKAKRIAKHSNRALVGCEQYNIGDTLIMNKKNFTNY